MIDSKVINLEAHHIDREAKLPVWRVVKGRCTTCAGGQAVSVQHEECPLDGSECGNCGQMTWSVTHFELDNRFVPRLEIV